MKLIGNMEWSGNMDVMKNRTWVEIDLDNIVHNYHIAKNMAPGKKVMCVIKADAYGHGSVAVAKALSTAGVSYFAVATAEEALQLRRNGINNQILLLGTAAPKLIPQLNKEDILLTVSSITVFKAYESILNEHGLQQKIHVKINSGMARQGINVNDAVEQIISFSKNPHFTIEGVYTHLAAADDQNEGAFSKKQYEVTSRIINILKYLGVEIPLFHISNSAGIISNTCNNADMIRPGIMLYGSNPCKEKKVDLKPTMTLNTRVTNIIELVKGETVGYGRTWKADRDSKIAILSIGYADGLMRCLSGKLSVLINGKTCKQVGRICMDMCMVDVTDLPTVKLGDIATIIGQQGDYEVKVDEVAEMADTISYEVFCAIGKRVPRVYKQEEQEIYSYCAIDSL